MRKICFISMIIIMLNACKINGQYEKITNLNLNIARLDEKYRPQIHFSPAQGWMNDPNGMVFYDGNYHLFYQHYPYDTKWGPMHWGHAVSTDLIHWEHLYPALSPDSLGYIFSGSAIVDWKNTSGLGTGDNPPLIAFFTYHNTEKEKIDAIDVETQAIAYSNDSGYTWIKYEKNPVIKNPGIRDFRDPKVRWHEESKHWIMSIASQQVIRFYRSGNCIDWSYTGEFGDGYGSHDGVWECPDLFPLKVNNTNDTKWVLIVNINPGGPAGGSATQYFIGDFDGKTFTTNQNETLWMDYGKDNYAGVTWSDAPDNRKILIGWMNNWQYAGNEPTANWSGAATFPRELGLVKDNSKYLLTSSPVKELAILRQETVTYDPLILDKSFIMSEKILFNKTPLEINITFGNHSEFSINQAKQYGICLKNEKGEYITLGYNNQEKVFYVDRTSATGEIFSDNFESKYNIPYFINSPDVEWQLLIDASSVELFAAGNRIVITNTFYPSEPFDIIELFTKDGSMEVKRLSATQLKSIYN